MREKNPFILLNNVNKEVKLKRVLLKDRATELLRHYIIVGHLPPGTKLVEREVAKFLGISRVPVRDALLELEKEGLVVVRSNARRVIKLSEQDIRELYQVRLALEKVAVGLATQNTSPENRTALSTKLQEMKKAFAGKNFRAFIKNDLETHRLIWQQADNRHLLNVLNAMVGPIFMFMASNAEHYPWKEALELHQKLVTYINSGNVRQAVKIVERHMDDALHRSLSIHRKQEIPATSPLGG